ncbi:receptor-like protein kinase [Trifolium pratense]|uniref:receptor-like protein kinase n=1 Tax=Trifolium pratense TaxID=57577 RepID=UPI001E691DDF|nr:receptor-like protein kinase [Trifolium pratense]
MKNGSLHDILHEKKPPPPLTWNVRCKIAVGIAQGLLYLHYDCVPRIVHRDIKPKNILVDDNMEPIIADFGTALCKKVFEDSNSHSTIRKMLSSHVVGTPGYIAPENAYDIVPGRKSDVYSYGVVLLELLTRKKLLVPSLNDEAEDTPLVIWARSVWMETGKIEKIVDPYLASEFSSSVAIAKQVAAVLSLAFRCIEKDPGKRPNMKGVISIYNKNLFKLRRDEVQYVDVLAIKLMGNGKLQADKFVRIASLIVPKITYSSRSLIFLSSITGPILTKPFNWFFLLRWGQYRHLQKSLGAHGVVYKAVIDQLVCSVKKVEFEWNKKKRMNIMRNEIEVLEKFKHRNLIKCYGCWIGDDYGLILSRFMENGCLHDTLHEKKPPPPLTWNVGDNNFNKTKLLI